MNLSIVQELGARPTPEGLPLEGGGGGGSTFHSLQTGRAAQGR